MQMRSNSHQVIQIIFIIFLMGIIAWLATGWQEQSPLQLGLEQEYSQPWSEAHLITPVNTQTQIMTEHQLKAM